MSKKGYTTKLSSIATVLQGQSPESKYYSDSEGIPFLQGNRTFGSLYPSFDTFTEKVTKLAQKGDVLMSVRAPVGALNFAPCDLCIGRGLASLRAKNSDNKFIYYALKYNVGNLIKQGAATTFDSINKDIINDFELIIPEDENDRQKVASFLSALDEKIELNNKINTKLEAMAKTLYDYWFVQFDFPDENGKPYKTSGGKMVWSDDLKREIPVGWEVKKVSDLLPILTGKQDANFATENGEYNFFTCGEEILKCNSYEFEGKAVLVAGNGNFNIKLYDGKFNAYQRTYVLIPSDENYYTVVYMAVKDRISSLTKGSRGSIVKFITKGDLESIQIALPKEKLLDIFSPLNTITKKIEKNIEENQKLAELRDWLLPMLMNGQVKLKEEISETVNAYNSETMPANQLAT